MEKQRLHVLIVDDREEDLLLLQRQLSRISRFELTIDVVTSAERGLAEMLTRRHDLYLVDYYLGADSGVELLEEAKRHGIRTPIIILTGLDSPHTDDEAMQAGAADYLVKGRFDVDLLERTIRHACERAKIMTELYEQEERITHSRKRLLSILDQLSLGTLMVSETGSIDFINAAGEAMLGESRGDLLGRPWQSTLGLTDNDRQQIKRVMQSPVASREKHRCHLATRVHPYLWVDLDVKDDPRDSQQKILYLYDVSDLHHLTTLLDERLRFHDLIVKSPPMLAVVEQIRQVALVDSTVLIEGETGTGKELVARAIHSSGSRANGPFIAMNCAGLSESLLESQLFGHKRGAFTGAVNDYRGVFEAANGGTLLIDEIGDIPAHVQTRLLRVLQEKEIVRLGESVPRKINVRIVAATHRDLASEVQASRFREDLLYRIRVARITIPPLRARATDIPLLAEAFLSEFRTTLSKPVTGIDPLAMAVLCSYRWPGNVRELKAAIEFALIRAHPPTIRRADLPPELAGETVSVSAKSNFGVTEDIHPRASLEIIESALHQTKGNRSKAAKLLGMSRATFYRRLSALRAVSSS